ncbi:probable malate dehydrogenase, mitochondrial [Cephus cinctus]|uniref:Probable malate dehydrogenase, mitochondrial n=1 Tax=Cephus cinctus TaxID=211228 RepID=A0AAJ7CGJ7_CEPCN|nr:probable malate dehydrogenase, mitochondrial [Cephus cinctus]
MDIIALMDETDFDMGKAGPLAQFMVTSTYVKRMAEKMIHACPTALVAIFARPVTSSLAMVSELYKRAGWWDPDRIIGSTAIDCMRIEAMAAHLLDLNPAYFSVPIVGGADPCTVVPLLSHAKPINLFTKDQENMLLRRLRSADKELASTELKGPKISSGAAAAKLIVSLAGGLSGYKNIISCAFVRSNVLPVCRFYASELEFGPNGVQKNYGLPKVSQRELSLIEESIPLINEYVSVAIDNVHSEKEEKIKV